jgi:hypothetical protein
MTRSFHPRMAIAISESDSQRLGEKNFSRCPKERITVSTVSGPHVSFYPTHNPRLACTICIASKQLGFNDLSINKRHSRKDTAQTIVSEGAHVSSATAIAWVLA